MGWLCSSITRSVELVLLPNQTTYVPVRTMAVMGNGAATTTLKSISLVMTTPSRSLGRHVYEPLRINQCVVSGFAAIRHFSNLTTTTGTVPEHSAQSCRQIAHMCYVKCHEVAQTRKHTSALAVMLAADCHARTPGTCRVVNAQPAAGPGTKLTASEMAWTQNGGFQNHQNIQQFRVTSVRHSARA